MPAEKYTHGARDQRADDQKLAELIIYIAQRSEGDDKFGATKLNKILFFSDFSHYAQHGQSITGQEYQALPQGPCPRRLMPIQRRLARQNAIAVLERTYYGHRQNRTFALRDPDLSLFTASEIALVDRIIHRHWQKSATEISDHSHQFAGYRAAREGETIPYNVVFIEQREPTQDEIEYGLEIEASLS